jgi:hypothetical protein
MTDQERAAMASLARLRPYISDPEMRLRLALVTREKPEDGRKEVKA